MVCLSFPSSLYLSLHSSSLLYVLSLSLSQGYSSSSFFSFFCFSICLSFFSPLSFLLQALSVSDDENSIWVEKQ